MSVVRVDMTDPRSCCGCDNLSSTAPGGQCGDNDPRACCKRFGRIEIDTVNDDTCWGEPVARLIALYQPVECPRLSTLMRFGR